MKNSLQRLHFKRVSFFYWATLALAVGMFIYACSQVFPLITAPLTNLQLVVSTFLAEAQLTGVMFLPVVFACGVMASLSPCCISMLPVHLAYIGAVEAVDRKRSVSRMLLFFGGMVTTLTVLGLFSSVSGAVFLYYREYVLMLIGCGILLFGLSSLGFVKIPFWRLQRKNAAEANGGRPVLFGLSFPLIASPCSSPILLTVLGIAATVSKPLSVSIMIAYGCGYAMIFFICGLGQSLLILDSFRPYAKKISVVSGVFMTLIGLGYLVAGVGEFAKYRLGG